MPDLDGPSNPEFYCDGDGEQCLWTRWVADKFLRPAPYWRWCLICARWERGEMQSNGSVA